MPEKITYYIHAIIHRDLNFYLNFTEIWEIQ